MKKSGNRILDSMVGDNSTQSHFALCCHPTKPLQKTGVMEKVHLCGGDTGAKHLAAVNFTASMLLFTQIQ